MPAARIGTEAGGYTSKLSVDLASPTMPGCHVGRHRRNLRSWATEAPRMPTVRETIRTYSGLSELRARSISRGVLLTGASLLGLALLLPPIDRIDSRIFPYALVLLGPALGAAYREYRFGGSPRLIIVAAMTSTVVGLILVAVWFVLWMLVGGRLASANPFVWFLGLPMEIQIGSLIALMILIVIGYFVRKPARERAADKFEAEVRAERTRRGLPTAP